ncbi:MAG: small multi-drug export protein [Candidatus Woesearchaeota archaeon]|nr:small multi-drug export protein [Candidatus Woesearchaeota archaeon]
MNTLITAIILSILPISELRGGIPAAICGGIPYIYAFLICTAFNIAIIFPTFFFLDYINKHLLKIKLYRRFFEHQVKKAQERVKSSIDRYGYPGLSVFVGIPLPFTGAYTGTLAAWVLGMDRKKAVLAIALGVVMAGIIVTAVSVLGISSLRIFVNMCAFPS